MSTTASDPFVSLRNAEYIVLTTYRKDGRAVPTTVWFAAEGTILYVSANARSGKVKRLRQNPQVTVSKSDRVGNTEGPVVEAVGDVLSPDNPQNQAALNALMCKYGETFERVRAEHAMLGEIGTDVFITIAPGD